MRATLIFKLPEDQDAFQTAQDGILYRAVITDYSRWLRDICKHSDPKSVDAEKAREKLFEICNEYEVTI